MNRLLKTTLLLLSISFLSGCASTKENIALKDNFWKNKNHKIAIVKTKVKEKPKLHKMGPQGLLDLAINSTVTKKFDKYLNNTSLNWYKDLPEKFARHLKKREMLAQTHPHDIDPKQTDKVYSFVKTENNKILLIELVDIGAIRHYYSFIPTDNPKAYCVIRGELIDKQENKVLWRHLAKIEKDVNGDWDQPPYYPNFTVALNQAINLAQEEIMNSFFFDH